MIKLQDNATTALLVVITEMITCSNFCKGTHNQQKRTYNNHIFNIH